MNRLRPSDQEVIWKVEKSIANANQDKAMYWSAHKYVFVAQVTNESYFLDKDGLLNLEHQRK